MLDDTIRYDLLHSAALRGVVRQVMQRVQKRGLPGEHFFEITFVTKAEGVVMSPRLIERFPTVMTIVLQHQFWDLLVGDDRFEVKLTFKTVPERLVIPFSAIVTFADPHADFAFNPNLAAMPEELVALIEAQASDIKLATQEQPERAATDAPVISPETPPDSSGSVVQLDRFRRR